jgi:Domain of unknown function (DUF4160)
MPTISIFWGVIFQMYWNDHAPPHFHAKYGEYSISIDINNLKLIDGNMPHKTLKWILEWAEMHQQELLINWELCQQGQAPNKILPME